MRSKLFPALVLVCLIGLVWCCPTLWNLYERAEAIEDWERQGHLVACWGKYPRSPQFRAVMRTFGIKKGDPVERLIDILGEPDLVRDAPAWGVGVKWYEWKGNAYLWPEPTTSPMRRMIEAKMASQAASDNATE